MPISILMLESDLDLYYCCADVKGLTWPCVTNGLLHVLCRMLLVATISQPVRLSVVKPLHKVCIIIAWYLECLGISWNSISMQTVFDFAGDQVSVLLPLNHLIATVMSHGQGLAERIASEANTDTAACDCQRSLSLSLHQWLQLLKGLSQLSHLDSLNDIIHRRWRHVGSFATIEAGCAASVRF